MPPPAAPGKDSTVLLYRNHTIDIDRIPAQHASLYPQKKGPSLLTLPEQ